MFNVKQGLPSKVFIKLLQTINTQNCAQNMISVYQKPILIFWKKFHKILNKVQSSKTLFFGRQKV